MPNVRCLSLSGHTAEAVVAMTRFGSQWSESLDLASDSVWLTVLVCPQPGLWRPVVPAGSTWLCAPLPVPHLSSGGVP